MRFEYVKLGVARIVDHDGTAHPIEGNYIYGVRTIGTGTIPARVLGLVQRSPAPELPEEWRAVAALDDTFPRVDFDRGLWQMTPGQSGFKHRHTAAVWLLGASDARQSWFNEQW